MDGVAEADAAQTYRNPAADAHPVCARSSLLGPASREEPGVRGCQHLGNTPLTFLIFSLLCGQDPILTTSSFMTQMVTLTWSKEWWFSHSIQSTNHCDRELPPVTPSPVAPCA